MLTSLYIPGSFVFSLIARAQLCLKVAEALLRVG